MTVIENLALWASKDERCFERCTRVYCCCLLSLTAQLQARLVALQLLWDKVEGNILGECRAKRAAVESRAAVSFRQILHIRKIAAGLIKVSFRWQKLFNGIQRILFDRDDKHHRLCRRKNPGWEKRFDRTLRLRET